MTEVDIEQRARALEYMEPLAAPPPLRERQSAQSYLAELAAYYACRNPRDFCGDFGLSVSGIQRGEQWALAELAKLTGANLEELIRCTPVRVSVQLHRIGLETFRPAIGPRSVLRLCPVCARDDIAAHPDLPADIAVYDRFEWMTGFLGVCDIHHVRLIERKSPSLVIENVDRSYQSSMLLDDVLACEPVPSPPTDFESYVLNRIRGVTPVGPSLLNSLPLFAVDQICNALGRDMAAFEDTNADTRTVKAMGFGVLAQGLDGLCQLLCWMRELMTVGEMARKAIPLLLNYVTRPPDGIGEDPKRLVAAAAFATLPYGEGDILMGVVCPRRSVHTFSSAGREYGLTPLQLEAFAKCTPGLGSRLRGKVEDILVDRDIADATFTGRTPYIGPGTLAKMHGRRPSDVNEYADLLVGAGIIRPAREAPDRLSPYLFSLPELLRDQEEFCSGFERTNEERPGMVSLMSAVARIKISMSALLKRIAARELRYVSVVEGLPFARALRVNAAEVLSLVSGVDEPVLRGQAAKELGVHTASVGNLIAEGHLKTIDMKVPTLSPILTRAELNRFKAKYIGPRAANLAVGVKSPKGMRQLGIHPAIYIKSKFEGQHGAVFYLVADIERVRRRR